MCYNIEIHLENTLKRARHYGDEDWIQKIEEALKPFKLKNYYQVSGFSHPEILIYTNKKPFKPTVAKWGLIPHWVKDLDTAIRNKTINARGESIFEKPSFKNSARTKRCLIYVNGFYEHHYFNGKTYPYYVYNANNEPFILGGLWDEWVNKNTGEVYRTCSIITTVANKLMSRIHNNPKLPESRMPFILKEEDQQYWLNVDNRLIEDELSELIRPSEDENMQAHTVQKLSGKQSLGNVAEAKKEYFYQELNTNTLF